MTIVKDHDYFSKIGKKGGDETAKRGREYYQRIGSKGGRKSADRRVQPYYSLPIPPEKKINAGVVRFAGKPTGKG